ncbi:MBL fold metallo-hydrolase [Dickeya zeae]|uniref:MBL fold metallo-hydrolase n=1 Tax=Dickeya zeae TaxID=204042 RepID=A0AAE6Z1N5_9GAMM|nr:MBL fold metallo-hydrolase [Dickeya zeae]QIZ51745.1 MBL fold metallo-hydrolase [Dickeya zeae]
MFSRRQILKAALVVGSAAVFIPNGPSYAARSTLAWQHFPMGPNGFFRAPVLVSGPSEALLIDAGFTYSDGKALAAAIKVTGKKLTVIYISQSDPDYYFSLKPILEEFPDAKVLAASATLAAIKGNVRNKLTVWGPQLKENGPQTLADIVFPEAFDGPSLTVDKEIVEIIAAEPGLANRRYLWVPSLNAVFGGVLVFSGVHVWTADADTQTKESRAAWIATLDAIAARKPAVVVAGHLVPKSPTDLTSVAYTKAYLLAFEEELPKAANASALKAAMEARFPNLDMGVALDIGSKVAKGEMKWN